MAKGNFVKLITVRPEILRAGSCSSGKSEDGDVRVILSGAVPQAQPALSFKNSYERDREAGDGHLRAQLQFQREIRKPGGMSGFPWGAHRNDPALPAAAVPRRRVVSTGAACQRASNRGKKIHLTSSNLWEHHCRFSATCLIRVSLRRSPSVQNTINPPKAAPRRELQRAAEAGEEFACRRKEKMKRWELQERTESRESAGKRAWETPLKERGGGRTGKGRCWERLLEERCHGGLRETGHRRSHCRAKCHLRPPLLQKAPGRSPRQRPSLFGGGITCPSGDSLHKEVSLGSDGLPVPPLKFCSLRALRGRSFSPYPNVRGFLGKYPVIHRCLGQGPLQSSPPTSDVPGPHRPHPPTTTEPWGLAQKAPWRNTGVGPESYTRCSATKYRNKAKSAVLSPFFLSFSFPVAMPFPRQTQKKQLPQPQK